VRIIYKTIGLVVSGVVESVGVAAASAISYETLRERSNKKITGKVRSPQGD
jgi:hypothetical protein